MVKRREEEAVRADAHDVLLDEIAARLDLHLVDVRPVGGVVVHEDETPLLGTEDEIGVMRGRLVVVDDDVRAAVAADDVAAHAYRERFTPRRAVQAYQPADHVPFLLLAELQAL